MLNKNALSLEDRLMRSYGIFTNARRMDVKEFMQRISDIRLAVDLGFLDLPRRELDTLLLAAQPAAIQRRLGPEASKEEIDFERAKIIRRSLK
jgi:protein arginine kinase